MTALSGVVLGAVAGWLGAWAIERMRYSVGPLEMLVRWLVCLRAAGMLATDAAGAAWARRERWQEYLDRARREA